MLTVETSERFRALAASRGPLLVATDLDGTLAPIVDHASDARVPVPTVAVLDRLAGAAQVAVITGRDLNTARRLVAAERVTIVGSHGLEASFESDLLPPIDRVALATALESVEQNVMSAVPSAFLHIERKSISTAFHFRTAPALEMRLREALSPLPHGLRLREGRMVLEVVPDQASGKDVALVALLRHVRPGTLLCVGDDLTDAVMFRAAARFRERGVVVLLAGVSGGKETPLEIVELSDILLRSTGEALEALETVARALGV